MGMEINTADLDAYNKQVKIYPRIKRTSFGTTTRITFLLCFN